MKKPSIKETLAILFLILFSGRYFFFHGVHGLNSIRLIVWINVSILIFMVHFGILKKYYFLTYILIGANLGIFIFSLFQPISPLAGYKMTIESISIGYFGVFFWIIALLFFDSPHMKEILVVLVMIGLALAFIEPMIEKGNLYFIPFYLLFGFASFWMVRKERINKTVDKNQE